MEVTNMANHTQLRCSFCGKKETEILKLVAGPHVYICDQCVALASQIMNDPHDDNQPPEVKLTVWRRLVTRVKQFWGRSDVRRVGSLAFPVQWLITMMNGSLGR